METKPYLVIARKYRPQTFDEIMGQEALATTIKNAIQMNRIGHAYLFTGPRGVGKTSMARIFAKALNCKSGPTIKPCGKCSSCVEIEHSRSLDVLEIDGASNRGIDEIRSLRENTRFAPAVGKYKIYIIDEVHQITSDGFNALLKTLEEPPAHVKFIFATTSAQKVPATILSRCQRFDFRRIATETIVEALKGVCASEKIQIDSEALFAIAKAADGSLRDSQSILDQIAASNRERVSKKEVLESLGALDEEKWVELTDALAARDAAISLRILDALLCEGKDPALFLEKFLEHIRNLLFIQVSEKLADLIDATESYKKELARQKNILSKEDLFYFFSVISNAHQTLKRFELKRVPLEIALIKLCDRVPMESISEALRAFKALGPAAPAADRKEEKKTEKSSLEIRNQDPEPEDEEDVAIEDDELPEGDLSVKPAIVDEGISLESVWANLIQGIKAEKISVATYLAEGSPMEIRENIAWVSFPVELNFHKETLEFPDNARLIERHLAQLLGRSVRVQFSSVNRNPNTSQPAPKIAGGAIEPSNQKSPQVEGAIKSAMSIFGGRPIR